MGMGIRGHFGKGEDIRVINFIMGKRSDTFLSLGKIIKVPMHKCLSSFSVHRSHNLLPNECFSYFHYHFTILLIFHYNIIHGAFSSLALLSTSTLENYNSSLKNAE